jgi:peptide chain release factor subunit 3
MYALPGENIKIKLKGVEDDDLQRGFMICDIDNHCHVTQEILCYVDLLELPEHKHIMSQGYSCVMHIHTAVHEIEITKVEAFTDPVRRKHLKASFLKSS